MRNLVSREANWLIRHQNKLPRIGNLGDKSEQIELYSYANEVGGRGAEGEGREQGEGVTLDFSHHPIARWLCVERGWADTSSGAHVLSIIPHCLSIWEDSRS